MTNEDESKSEKKGQRIMWITTAGIVLLILGMMGANVLFHKDSSSGPTDISTQSRPAS